MKRNSYPTDVTDEQWKRVEPLLPAVKPGGRPRKTDLRQVLNAVLYLVRTGCQWRMLPHEYPPWKTVYNYYRAWIDGAVWEEILATLRIEAREQMGRDASPSVGAVDSQSVKTEHVGEETGYDAGKKVKGRKRHLAVDSLGFLLAVVVTAASVDDGVAAKELFGRVDSEAFPRLETIYGDAKYNNHELYGWMEDNVDYRLHIVRRPEDAKGFVLLPQRWVAERTIAWFNRSRRLSKDRERLIETSEAMVQISAIHNRSRVDLAGSRLGWLQSRSHGRSQATL